MVGCSLEWYDGVVLYGVVRWGVVWGGANAVSPCGMLVMRWRNARGVVRWRGVAVRRGRQCGVAMVRRGRHLRCLCCLAIKPDGGRVSPGGFQIVLCVVTSELLRLASLRCEQPP